MNKVLISILNFNGKANTEKCLASLEDLTKSNFELEVVVLDNGSKEKLDLDIDKYKKLKLTLITSPTNEGFSGGHNIVIKYAFENSFDYIVILNNDVIVEKNLIKELLEGFKKENVGVTSPKIYFTKGHEYHKDKYKKDELGKVFWYAGFKMDWANLIGSHVGVDEVDRGQYDEEKEMEFATGACMMISLDVLKKVGKFDDRYFLYYEDADLNMRIRKAGYKILFTPKAVMWHNNAGSGGGSGSILQDYYITRNRMLLGMSYAPMRTKIALIKESLKILASGRPWQKKGIRDFFLGKLGRGSFSA